jgi:hypothetical protein
MFIPKIPSLSAMKTLTKQVSLPQTAQTAVANVTRIELRPPMLFSGFPCYNWNQVKFTLKILVFFIILLGSRKMRLLKGTFIIYGLVVCEIVMYHHLFMSLINAYSFNRKQRGRLKLCSHSILFDPLDTAYPILKVGQYEHQKIRCGSIDFIKTIFHDYFLIMPYLCHFNVVSFQRHKVHESLEGITFV